MTEYENECLGCDVPYMGSHCPNRRVPHYYCDDCGEEIDIYEFEEEELCIDCIKDKLVKVGG